MAATPASSRPRLVVGMSGASGAAIGIRIVELLAHEIGADVHLVVSRGAERTIDHEIGVGVLERVSGQVTRHGIEDIGASIASGSFRTAGMIVAPCSMRTLAAIATGNSDSLLLRAADVHLKERRRLVLLTRESPLHLGHLRNMTTATELGAIIAPPVPAFYLKPRTIDDVVEFSARRAIDALNLEAKALSQEWTGQSPAPQAARGPAAQGGWRTGGERWR